MEHGVTVIPVGNGALETILKSLRRSWNSWKSEEKSRLFRIKHCSDRLEFREKS